MTPSQNRACISFITDNDKHFSKSCCTQKKKGHTFGVTTKLYKKPFALNPQL